MLVKSYHIHKKENGPCCNGKGENHIRNPLNHFIWMRGCAPDINNKSRYKKCSRYQYDEDHKPKNSLTVSNSNITATMNPNTKKNILPNKRRYLPKRSSMDASYRI